MQIKAKLIELHVGAFETEEDRRGFDILCNRLHDFNNGITITPIYSDDGELMSLIIDSNKAAKILKEICDEDLDRKI